MDEELRNELCIVAASWIVALVLVSFWIEKW